PGFRAFAAPGRCKGQVLFEARGAPAPRGVFRASRFGEWRLLSRACISSRPRDPHSKFGVFREFRDGLRVSRAAETTGTALNPLSCSSAVVAPCTEEHLVFCSTASGSFQRPGKPPDAF